MLYKNILLIDDDDDDQEIFLTALGMISASISCTVLSNAREALDKLKDKVLVPEVIFLDLNMPVMNGQQFLQAIKKDEELNDIPVIIFSTSSHPATISLVREMGASEFVTKPDDFATLIKVLNKYVG